MEFKKRQTYLDSSGVGEYQDSRDSCTTQCCVVISRMAFRGGWEDGGMQFHYRSGSASINHQGRRSRFAQRSGDARKVSSWAWYFCFIRSETSRILLSLWLWIPRISEVELEVRVLITTSEKLLQVASIKYRLVSTPEFTSASKLFW